MAASLTAELLNIIRRSTDPISNREARQALGLPQTRQQTTRVSNMLADLTDRGAIVAIESDTGGRVYVPDPAYLEPTRGRPRTTPELPPKPPHPPKPAKPAAPGSAKVKAACHAAGAKLLLSHSVREAENAMQELLGKNLSDADLALRLAGAINAHWPGGRPAMPLELHQLTAEAARRFHSPDARELKPLQNPPARCAERLMRTGKLNSRVRCEVCGPFSPRRRDCAVQMIAAPE